MKHDLASVKMRNDLRKMKWMAGFVLSLQIATFIKLFLR